MSLVIIIIFCLIIIAVIIIIAVLISISVGIVCYNKGKKYTSLVLTELDIPANKQPATTLLSMTNIVRDESSDSEVTTPVEGNQSEMTPVGRPEVTPVGRPEVTPVGRPEVTPVGRPEVTPVEVVSQLSTEETISITSIDRNTSIRKSVSRGETLMEDKNSIEQLPVSIEMTCYNEEGNHDEENTDSPPLEGNTAVYNPLFIDTAEGGEQQTTSCL